MRKLDDKTRKRLRRKMRIRKRIRGTQERPRMTIYKSNRFTYVQVVDDVHGTTLAAASNREKGHMDIGNRVADLEKLGALIGERLKGKNIAAVVFDRNGYPFHGKVKAVAEGARKAGVQF